MLYTGQYHYQYDCILASITTVNALYWPVSLHLLSKLYTGQYTLYTVVITGQYHYTYSCILASITTINAVYWPVSLHLLLTVSSREQYCSIDCTLIVVLAIVQH